MIVLHGAFVRDQFLLWAETSVPAQGLAVSQNTQSSQDNSNSRHSAYQTGDRFYRDEAEQSLRNARTAILPHETRAPGMLSFAATYSALRDALSQAPVDLSLARRQGAQVILNLPALGDQVLASSSLIGLCAEEISSDELAQVRVKPVVVTGYRLTSRQMIDLLSHCLEQDQLAAGIIIGQDLQYWALCMRFGGSIVSKQQFLPGLRIGVDGGIACWEPVFPGDDGDRLVRLSAGMPLSCLAAENIEEPDLEHLARIVLVRFLGQIVDHLVRKSYEGQSVLLPGQFKSDSGTMKQLHARWLIALIGKNATFEATHEELAALSCQIAEWRRPVEIASDSPFRLCFRLEEPPTDEARFSDVSSLLASGSGAVSVNENVVGEGRGIESGSTAGSTTQSNAPGSSNLFHGGERSKKDGWYLRFLLQSIKEPSQVLPVETVLSPAFEELQLLRGGTVTAREYLFRSLGQAVRLCPEISDSFNQEKPLGVHLSTQSAYDFLALKSPLLKNAGFSIQLPAWWTNQKQQLTVGINIKDGNRLMSLDQLAEFNWQVALGDMPLSEDELVKLSQLRLPLVCMNGKWTELNPDQLNGILNFLRKRRSNLASGRDLVRMGLGDVKLPDSAAFGGITGGGVVCDVVGKLHGQHDLENVSPAPEFAGRLRPYQMRGIAWLEFLRNTGFGACLADDMGLGKTVQTLAFIQRTWMKQRPDERRPTLLVCPTSLLGNWLREAEKFTPGLEVILHHGTERSKGADFSNSAKSSALVLTTYNLLHRDIDDLRKIEWETVILDEAQNIKNPNAQQTQAAFTLRSRFRIALSGTPVENSVADLWSLMHFLNPGFLGRQSDFHERFFVPIQVFQDQQKMRQLRRLTAPFILRRLKTDKTILPELPDKFERKITCTLTKEQAAMYAAVVADAAVDIDQASGIRRKSLVLTTLLRLKQICDHPALLLPDKQRLANRSGKLKALTDMLASIIAAGEKALVFTQFTDMGELIQAHLQSTFGVEILYLHGAVERTRRERMVERFQSEHNGPPVFVLSLKAGGTGLNLTKAAHVIHFDRWWNPAVEDQATDRAFRIGQSAEVQVHKFVCAGTLEERIDEIIEGKKNLAASMIGAGEGWLTELSTEQLKDVLSLRNTALID